MVLYHGTTQQAWDCIAKCGLKPNGMGIIYLTPEPSIAQRFGPIVLQVTITNQKVTAFEDCKEWEALCWGRIPAKHVSRLI